MSDKKAPLAPYVTLSPLCENEQHTLLLLLADTQFVSVTSREVQLLDQRRNLLATVELSAWKIYESTQPDGTTPLPEYVRARRALEGAFRSLRERPPSDPYSIEMAGTLTHKNDIAGPILWDSLRSLRFLCNDDCTLSTLEHIAQKRLEIAETIERRRQHLFAFLAGHEPFHTVTRD